MHKSYGIDPVDETNFGREIAGTLTSRHDSSPCVDRGQNVVLQPCDVIFGINLKEVAYTVDTTIVHGVAICSLEDNVSDGRRR